MAVTEDLLKAEENTDIYSLILQLHDETDLRKLAREKLASEGAVAVPLLVERITDPSFTLRWEIANLLGRIGDPLAIEPLVDRVLHDNNVHVRWRSMWALKSIGDASIADRLAGYLGESDSAAWNSAVALSLFEDRRALPLLHRGLESPDPWIRWEAVNAIGRVHDRASAERLSMLLADPDRRIRQEVVLSLGKIGCSRAVRSLVHALEDASAQVRWRAAMVLGRSSPLGEDLQLLEDRLEVETDPLVREHLARAVGRN